MGIYDDFALICRDLNVQNRIVTMLKFVFGMSESPSAVASISATTDPYPWGSDFINVTTSYPWSTGMALDASHTVSTPMNPVARLTPKEIVEKVSEERITEQLTKIKSFICIAITSRLDIAYAGCVRSRFLSCPSQDFFYGLLLSTMLSQGNFCQGPCILQRGLNRCIGFSPCHWLQ